jgi:la-related protein 1
VNGDKSVKAVISDAEASSRRTSVMPDSNGQVPGQNNTYPRQYASRPGKGRRGDFNGQDRRKDGESVSPTKENGMHHERGTSMAMHAEGKASLHSAYHACRLPIIGLEDGERRAPNLADGPHSHPSKRGSSDRQYASYTNRDRNNRGGARGGRGNHQNGHQYANGHMPSVKNASTYPGPLSPTAFNGDVNHYFAPPSGRYKGPRSQSVAENMYRMPVPYGGPQQVAPIQTYAPGMYDFPPAQPMSAVPFANYSMDQSVVYGMVSTQLYVHSTKTSICSANTSQGVLLLLGKSTQGHVSAEADGLTGFRLPQHHCRV